MTDVTSDTTSDADRADAELQRSVTAGRGGRQVVRGLSWTMGGEWFSYLLQIGTTMVLARLLSPEIFGVMAMAMTLTVLIDQFRSLGLSQAVVQRENLTWTQVNALFWVNTAVGVVLAGVVAATGPALATFYDEPQVAIVCAGLGAGYVLSGLAVQHGALLNRTMRFRTITVRNLVARVGSSIAAIVAAFAGMGVWALVIQQVSTVLLSTVLTWVAVRWRPSWPRGMKEAAPLVAFGSLITASNLLNAVSRQADNIIIGRELGSGALGLYTRAYSLLTLPLRQIRTPIGAVMIPTLSALQGEPLRYRSAYRRSISGLAHVGFPVVVVLAVAADDVVEVFLGNQWTAAAPIFRLLAVASFVQLITTTCGWLFVSSGRGRAAAGWAAFGAVVTVAAFLVGVRWGVTGVAAAYAICQVVLAAPAFAVATRNTPVHLTDPLMAVLRPAAVAVVVLLVTIGAASAVPPGWPALARLVLVGLAGVATWAGVMAWWRTARQELLDLLSVVRRKERP